MQYTAYGLTIRTQIPLPELNLSNDQPEKAIADIDIRFAPVAKGGLGHGKQMGPFLWTDQTALWLQVPNVARFLISDGREILIDAEPGIDEDSIRVFLLGSAFGALLFQRGYLVMHGNSIRIGDKCLVCVGHSGAGKSTLAAGFMKRGYDVLADDVVPIDEDCCALPGFPRIKLWQDAADKLRIDTQQLRRIRPEMEKFNQPVLNRLVSQPLPVRWIYILGSHNHPEILSEPIRGLSRFNPLRANTYRVRYLEGMALKTQHLKLCSKLAGKIHLARVTRTDLSFELDSLIDHILTDIRENP